MHVFKIGGGKIHEIEALGVMRRRHEAVYV